MLDIYIYICILLIYAFIYLCFSYVFIDYIYVYTYIYIYKHMSPPPRSTHPASSRLWMWVGDRRHPQTSRFPEWTWRLGPQTPDGTKSTSGVRHSRIQGVLHPGPEIWLSNCQEHCGRFGNLESGCSRFRCIFQIWSLDMCIEYE